MQSPALSLQYGRPNHFLLHVSDTHFVGDGLLYGAVDAEAHLAELLGQFEVGHARPEAIVVTGDMADSGDPAAYRRLRAIIEPMAVRLGARVIWVMGNHDSRAAVRVCLLDEEPSVEPIDRVHWFGGLRLVALDTSVPGRHHGDVTEAQLAWLAAELATPAPEGTLLAMHHPPVPSVLDLAVLVELQHQSRLAAVLAGTDVRAILAGHLHYSTTATFAGIPVSVASASCYTQDLSVPVDSMRSRDGAQAVNLVHVYPHTVMHSVAPRGAFPVVSTVSPEGAAASLRAAGLVMPPLGTAARSRP
ncbi:phosphodiesterase [Nakamurella panacisegetis]|nr:phosphodiesterase [Nakamurella panacisegetis]